MDMIRNRLEKNFRRLEPWARRHQIEAYRLYDRDIPEYPYIVDVYKDHYLLYDKSDAVVDAGKNHFNQVTEAVQFLFKAPPQNIVVKRRERQEGKSQYEKLDHREAFLQVQESQAHLLVNLHDYLDTGLFLDHRPIRQKIFKTAAGKKFLNLFCYTGSVSVFAALGGAETTSVDMSGTYLEWARKNFELNRIPLADHHFIQANALEYLRDGTGRRKFDVIFLDPPTFSNSKKMAGDFEVERDQEFLVTAAMNLLAPGGVLYFSNNKRRFKFSENLTARYAVRDISAATIPQDFHDQKIHHCFEIHHKVSR